MKTRSDSRARRKVTRKATPRKRPRASRSRSAKELDRALKQLKRAVSVTVSRADSVLASTDAIAQLAATRTKAQLVSSLLDDEVLTALYGLSKSDDNVSALRLCSRWLREHLSLEPVYEPGQVLDVPKGRLSAFDLIDGGDHSPSGICSVRIVAAGWKQGNKVLRKPVATTNGLSGSSTS
jgi:hypothetical protein